MSAINNGGPAFPIVGTHEQVLEIGVTIRDYFAAKAMAVLCADYCASARTIGFDEDWKMGVALDAYAMADAMLAARQHKREGCQNCGDTGIHACTGKPIDPMTGEKKEYLAKVLEKVVGRDADGWIEWKGGECPVSNETIVDVRFRDGERGARVAADAWRWEHYGEGREYADGDIIAYRVVNKGAKK